MLSFSAKFSFWFVISESVVGARRSVVLPIACRAVFETSRTKGENIGDGQLTADHGQLTTDK
jgi:hypothetical protein